MSQLRATLNFLENEDPGAPSGGNGHGMHHGNGGGSVAGNERVRKARTVAQDLKSGLSKAAGKLTESKGWNKKLKEQKV